MKKLVGLLLVAALLCGCSVTVTPTANSGTGKVSGGAVADPAEATLPSMESYAEDTGLVVTVSMGAEFEMVLNMFHAVLEVTPLNEVAEALLDGINAAGVSYRSAVEAILQEAQDQELLTHGTKITLTAKAVGTDSWTVASHNILTWPVENYQKNSALNFTCELIPAGKYFDSASYTDTFTRKRDDHYEVVCYAPNGAHQMTYSVFEDGTYWEDYYLSRDESIGCGYNADGSFFFSNYDNKGNGFTYTLHPDGSCEGQSYLYDAAGNLIMYASTDLDGSSNEIYYENGVTVRNIVTDPDGNVSESTYTPDGTPLTCTFTGPSGVRNEQTYFPNGSLERIKSVDANGDSSEMIYFENGNPATAINEYADGSYSEVENYENGMMRRYFWRSADGTETEEFYDENGNLIPAPTE